MRRKRQSIHADCPTPAPRLDALWLTLLPGDRVRLKHSSGHIETGLIDEATCDRTTVWVSLDHGHGRTLLHYADGIQILPN